jgi:hypothetical protein
MRLILVLITALVIGFLLEKQLNTQAEIDSAAKGSENSVVPKPPRNKEDLQKLRKDLNILIQDSAEKRAKSIER